MIQKEPVNKEAAAIVPEQLEQMRDLFPQAFTEGKIDFDKLKESLGEEIDSRPERYSFSWAGKRDAIRLLQTPSRATLVPAKKESINFDETNNVFIEGDNLEVLKLLYKSYFGRVKMIYIDPPYNTGNDFVYPDNFADPLDTYLKLTGQKTAEGNMLTNNPETSGRYHSAWLSMIYPRLFVARQLLDREGVICISIDDHEINNLRLIMNSIFGEENFIAQVTVINNPKGRVLGEHFAVCHDYVLVYSNLPLSKELGIKKTEEEVTEQYREIENEKRFRSLELRNTHRQFNKRTRHKLWFPLYVDPSSGKVSTDKSKGAIEVWPLWDDNFEGCWTWNPAKVRKDNRLLYGREVNGKWKIFRKAFAEGDDGEVVRKKLKTVWTEREYHTEIGQAEFDELIPGRVFEAPKPVGLLKQLIKLGTNDIDEDIVLDFFSGSCTTAHALFDLNHEDNGNRRFIVTQLPEPTPDKSRAREAGFKTISEIGKERIRRVVAKLRKEKEGKLDLNNGNGSEDLGFKVFKLAESNYKLWTGPENKDPEAYGKQMAAFTDPFVPGWKPENVVWEVIIKEGYGLNSEIIRMTGITENAVYHVTDPDKEQSFRICLDEVLKPAAIRALALGKNDLFICRDKAMTDELVANLALQCRLKTI